MVIYLTFLWLVFSNRKHPCVLPRSPTLVLIEGASLMLDSLINFVIMTQGVGQKPQCILGILTTVSCHYVALVSITLRAYRIRRFYDLYDEYF